MGGVIPDVAHETITKAPRAPGSPPVDPDCIIVDSLDESRVHLPVSSPDRIDLVTFGQTQARDSAGRLRLRRHICIPQIDQVHLRRRCRWRALGRCGDFIFGVKPVQSCQHVFRRPGAQGDVLHFPHFHRAPRLQAAGAQLEPALDHGEEHHKDPLQSLVVDLIQKLIRHGVPHEALLLVASASRLDPGGKLFDVAVGEDLRHLRRPIRVAHLPRAGEDHRRDRIRAADRLEGPTLRRVGSLLPTHSLLQRVRDIIHGLIQCVDDSVELLLGGGIPRGKRILYVRRGERLRCAGKGIPEVICGCLRQRRRRWAIAEPMNTILRNLAFHLGRLRWLLLHHNGK
mmetsp:Transcript_18531/g.47502  ORF Transcript_18531/g.47502 Transcript_18531/m.47502 type:complete len:342 (-) Transcript_18531:11-1036(-)